MRPFPPGGIPIPDAGGRADEDAIAPRREHGVVGVGLVGDVEGIAIKGRKGLDEGDVAKDLGNDGVLVWIDDHGAREDSTVDERLEFRTPQRRGPEVVVEMAVVVGFDVRCDLGGDATVGEIV